MKKLILFTSAAVAASALFAAPVVSDVVMTQVQDNDRTVVVNYTLAGEPGIVTVDVQTNSPNGWVSIGGEHLTYFAGDVNKKVEPGARTLTWKPRKAWQDNKVTENAQVVVSAWETNAPPDYMVVSLSIENSVTFYTCAEAVPFGVTNDMYKTDYLVMRKIPAANVQWRMGSPTTENGRIDGEDPHLVTLANDYYIGVYEVTQRQWQQLMGTTPSYYTGEYLTRPVELVSYNIIRGTTYSWPGDRHSVDSTSFIGKLQQITGIAGFDLPTEAQWEFACRAGCGSAYYNGGEMVNWNVRDAALDPLARYKWNGGLLGDNASTYPKANCTAENATAKVGSYLPNAWGLYDMLGNVAEWTLDWHQVSLDGVNPEFGPMTGTVREIRGGAYSEDSKLCRAARRRSSTPDAVNSVVGFRVACTAGIR